MMDEMTKAAEAYLHAARPEAERPSYDMARTWIMSDDREAFGLRCALRAVGVQVDRDDAEG